MVPFYAPDCSGNGPKMRCFIPTRDTQASTYFHFSPSLLQTQTQSEALLVKVKVNYQTVVASTT